MNVYDFGSTRKESHSLHPVENKHEKSDPVSLHSMSHMLMAAEFFIVLLAAFAAKVLYVDMFLHYGSSFHAPLMPYLAAGAGVALVNIYVFDRFGLYAPDRLILRGIKFSQMLVALVLSFMVLLSALYAFQLGALYSRIWLGVWFLMGLASITLVRTIVSLYIRALVAENRINQKIAIYGGGELGHRVGKYLRERYYPTIEIVGYYDEGELAAGGKTASRDGGLSELVELAQQNLCDQVIIAMPPDKKLKVQEIVGRLSILPVEVQYCPEIFELPFPVNGSRKLGDLHLLEVQHRPLSERSDMLKAAFDYVVGGLALVVFAPLMALIALAIKLDSKGPVFFVQKRHGYNHRIISVIKFRTMSTLDDGDVVVQAKKGDSRVTMVGAFLRKTSLDELPQLINVMKGDMSLIGPRPHALAHNALYDKQINGYSARHRVKPGITGWAQINGYRGNTEDPEMMRKRIEHDLHYIANWSLLFDLKILFLTPFKGFISQNAY